MNYRQEPIVVITRDYTVLDGQEIVFAYKDLGIEEISATFAYVDRIVKCLTLEENKTMYSLSFHFYSNSRRN